MHGLNNIENLYESSKGVTRVDEVLYYGESCYCIQHKPTHTVLLFDYDDRLCERIVNKIMRTKGGIMVRRKENDGYKFQFNGKGRERSVSIPLYLYTYYENIQLSRKMRRSVISTFNSSKEAEGIYDFRSYNLYKAASQIDGVKIIERPNHPDEKYILTVFDGRAAIQDFSIELYELFTNERLYLWNDKENKRIKVNVRYGYEHKEATSFHLSKIVLMFYKYFNRYRHKTGAVTRFIKDIPKINKELENCAHIDANSWNNATTNIMDMSGRTNRSMHDYIKGFLGEYTANPIILPKEGNIILVELQHCGALYYFRCNTAEDYCDFQKQFLGKTPVLENTTARTNGGDILTPKQARDRNIREGSKAFEIWDFWKYCDVRDRLYSLYNEAPGMFILWKKTESEGVSLEQTAYISCVVAGWPIPDWLIYQTFPIADGDET